MLTKIVFGLSVALVLGMSSTAMAMSYGGIEASQSANAQRLSAIYHQGGQDESIATQR